LFEGDVRLLKLFRQIFPQCKYKTAKPLIYTVYRSKPKTVRSVMHVFLRYIDHSQALKHDVDIPDNVGTGQAADRQ